MEKLWRRRYSQRKIVFWREGRRRQRCSGSWGRLLADDGNKITAQDWIMRIKGDVRSILACERVALNILSRMSGIATLVNNLVERSRKVNPGIRIACNRKTTPGFRFFEKKALVIGGGDPHRFSLDDCIMLKDNHLSMLGSICEGVKRAREFSITKKVEVEDLDGALGATEAGADMVMLDNMDSSSAERCYSVIRERYPSVIMEVSGRITPGAGSSRRRFPTMR